jgi:hypothetical protein
MTKKELEQQIEALQNELKQAKQSGLRATQYTDPTNGITYANQEVPVQVSNPSDTGGRFVFTIQIENLKKFLDTVPNDNQVSISTRLYKRQDNAKAQRLEINDKVFAGELGVSSKHYNK